MKVLGLTGRSGSGKGAFCKALESFGVPCLDTDKVARKVVEKGTPCLSELREHFGDSIILSDGSLDRKALGSIAFSDKNELAHLNSITHKYITKEVKEWLVAMKSEGYAAAAIDAPQLFESGEDAICDVTVALICSEEERIQRITARDGITQEYAEKRLSSQKPDVFFIEKCSHIIYNDGTEQALAEHARAFLTDIGVLKEEI